MKFQYKSHRLGFDLSESNSKLSELWGELKLVIESITDEEIQIEFSAANRQAKSISEALNKILDRKLVALGWKRQSRIFKDPDYQVGNTWTLDFSKSAITNQGDVTGMAVEVVFNHREAIAWNLIKPTLAAEKNHVPKEENIGAGVGVYICATRKLKEMGGFDNAVGEYETVLKYLDPLNDLIHTPLIIVGLEAPESFYISHSKDPNNPKKTLGSIKPLI